MGKKVYLDYSDVGRGCMPGVYNEPGEGRIEFEQKEEINTSLSSLVTESYRRMPGIFNPRWETASSPNTGLNNYSYTYTSEATMLGLTAVQIEALGNYFKVHTGLEPSRILHYSESIDGTRYPVSLDVSPFRSYADPIDRTYIFAISQQQLNELARFFYHKTGQNPDRVSDYFNGSFNQGITSGAAMELRSTIDSEMNRIAAQYVDENAVRRLLSEPRPLPDLPSIDDEDDSDDVPF